MQYYLMGAMAFAALLGAFGQFFLNQASGTFTFRTILTNHWLYAFAFVYGIAVIINILAYKAGGKMSIIYPVISLSYVFAALISWRLLGEHISAWTWIGTITIVLGVSLIGIGAAYA